MKHYRLLITLFLLNLLCAPTNAQQYLFDTELLTTEDGLANLMTNAIYQDDRGFIWIGTKYGLNRYDGYSFKLYNKDQHGLSQENAFSRISNIVEDDNGNLWLINRYQDSVAYDVFNPLTEKAVPFETYFENQLPFALSDLLLIKQFRSKNVICIITKTGALYVYQNKLFEKITEGLPSQINDITIDEDDDFWLAGGKKLIGINREGQILENLDLPGKVYNLWAGDDGRLWFKMPVYEGQVMKAYIWSKIKNKADLEPLFFTKDKKFLSSVKPHIRTKKGFWYATINQRTQVFDAQGVWLFDFHTLLDNETKSEIINHLDLGEQVWFTTAKGILKTTIRESPFRLILDNSYSSDFRGITEDDMGNVYFMNTNLFRWSPVDNTLYQFSDISGTYDLIYKDSLIWTSLHSYGDPVLGQELNLRTRQQLFYDNTTTNAMYAFSIVESRIPNKYLVGHTRGLSFLDLINKTILPFEQYNDFEIILKSLNVFHLHKNAEGIWLATNKGIFLMTEEQGVLQHFDKASGHLPYDHIKYIYEDESGDFWLATGGGGLIQWKPSLDSTLSTTKKQLTTQDGLPHDVLYAIYGDWHNRLWITTDKGLIQLDKASYQFKIYTTDNGLPHNEFNLTAHHQSANGTLYFGGLGGLITFNPNDVSSDSLYSMPLQVTSFHVLEKDSSRMTDRTELLAISDEIIINPSDKLFELKFALLDFDKFQAHRYAYEIEGYNNYEQTIEENFLRIPYLPYGTYTLKIRGQNIAKGWSEQELKLRIRVLKPFYLRWWFILAILLSVIGLVFMVIRQRIKRLKQDRQHLEAEVKKRTQKIEEDKAVIEVQTEKLKQLDKAKTRFFSNITHEFRTPLTLIIGPLEQLLEEYSAHSLQEKVGTIVKNARQLLNLVNQLLDLSKLEGGQMRSEFHHGDLVKYTRELVARFYPLAQQKQQQLNFTSVLPIWKTNFDKKKWSKIIYNLVSNAIKFTPRNGTVDVFLNKKEGKENSKVIQLMVKDTGIGISPEALNHIFDRFYQADSSSKRHYEGTGIGLALVKELVELQGGSVHATSQINLGTTFEVIMPIHQEATISDTTEEEQDVLSDFAVLKQLTTPKLDNIAAQLSEYSSKKKLELLLIEDNDEMRTYIRHCLDETQYYITEARDGKEGIEKAKERIPDLIISDVMMPRKNGFEVVRDIREDICTSHIPLILLTAKASLESRLEGLQRGADAYLTKPFSPKELVLRVQKLIEIRQLLQKRYAKGEDSAGIIQFEKEDEFISQLKTFIAEQLENPNLNGELISRHFAMSRMALYRKLKALTNQAISDFIRMIRLEVAFQMIKEDKLSLSEIAYSTGFSSLSHFSRTFKKVYGIAPSKLGNSV